MTVSADAPRYMQPVVHQKALTEAFVAQLNAEHDHRTLAAQPETQSLHTTTNGPLRSLHPSALASKEYLLQSVSNTAQNRNTGQMYASNGSKVFDGDENDWPSAQDTPNIKGYSVTGVQNVNAIGLLPNSFDGAVEARQNFQAQLNAANKPRSPRFLRRFGGNGGA